MEANEITEAIVYLTTFCTGVFMTAAGTYFKFRKTKASDDLDITANKTYSHVISELRTELDRMRLELNQLRADYRNDINGLEESQRLLEEEISSLRNKNYSMRNEAISAYSYVTTIEDLDDGSLTELKDRLMKIIVEDNVK